MNSIPSFLTQQRRVFVLVMSGALLITLLRMAAPFEVGKDQALQLEAALRLRAGYGLTSTYATAAAPHDISQPPQPKVLTWWPPVFSLLVAGLLQTGLALPTALKLLYALVTLTGWFGWSRIAAPVFARPLPLFHRKIPFGYLLAFLSPLFFTLSWNGTDILLWAAIPFFTLLLIKANARAGYWSIGGAGLLFGLLYGVRYASSFLGLAALLTLLALHAPKYKTALKQYAIFLVGALIFALPVVIFVRAYSTSGGLVPDYVDSGYGLARLTTTLHRVFNHLPVISNSVFAMPLMEEVVMNRIARAVFNYLFGLGCLAWLLWLPFALIKRKEPEMAKTLLSLSFLPLALTALLVAMVFITDQYMIEVSRYHEPIRLYGILIYYFFAASAGTPGLLRAASLLLLALFLTYPLLYLPAKLAHRERRAELTKLVLGYTPARSAGVTSASTPIHFPSNQLHSIKEASRAKLIELNAAHPQALFFAANYPFYVYDSFQTRAPGLTERLRVMHDEDFWRVAYTSRPIKIFWLLNEADALRFVPTDNRRAVWFDPFEKTVIFESDFPADYRFLLADPQ